MTATLFMFNGRATVAIYTYGHTLALHDALPISVTDLGHRRVQSPGCVSPGCVSQVAAQLGGELRLGVRRGVVVLHRQPLVRGSEEHTSELQSLMRISYAVFCLNKKNHGT